MFARAVLKMIYNTKILKFNTVQLYQSAIQMIDWVQKIYKSLKSLRKIKKLGCSFIKLSLGGSFLKGRAGE